MRGVGGLRKSKNQSWLAKVSGLRLGFTMLRFLRGVQKEIPRGRGQHSSNRVISTRTIHQSTTPSLSPTIWPKSASRQFLSLPKVQTLLLCDFWFSLKLRGCRYETIEEMKEAVSEGPWHAHTTGLSWGLPEVVGTVQQVHCSRRRLLRRGLEFHVCTVNKSAHTKKKSGNLSYAPRIWFLSHIL